MSANRFDYHLVAIPEDDANRQILNGFRNHLGVNSQKIQSEHSAGGWMKVLDNFKADHVPGMVKFPKRYLLMLIDFDGDVDRLETAQNYIPEGLKDRVFVLGCLHEPEELCAKVRLSKEAIGEALANACIVDETAGEEDLWHHSELKHNRAELERMKGTICIHLIG